MEIYKFALFTWLAFVETYIMQKSSVDKYKGDWRC